MRILAMFLIAGTAVGGAIVALRPPEPPSPLRITIPYPVPVPVEPPPTPPPPPPERRAACVDPPDRIGQPLAALPTAKPGASRWYVAAAADQCVIVAWSGRTLMASWDDGVTFAPVLENYSSILGVAVADDGTVFVTREDYTLGIAYRDGSTLTRTLAFRGAPLARGRWLVIRAGESPAISDDEGATWRQLDTPGGYLIDLRVLDDLSIVALVDFTSTLCDHFGCIDPTARYRETHLDGRPWQPATRRHVRAAAMVRKPGVRAHRRIALEPTEVLDSHRLRIGVAANRHVVRYTAGGWRLLFSGAS